MAQTKIYWDAGNYNAVEKLFRKTVEFCNENDIWKLNVAHVLFMQETKYKEAISFYEPIVKKNYDNVSRLYACIKKARFLKSLQLYLPIYVFPIL